MRVRFPGNSSAMVFCALVVYAYDFSIILLIIGKLRMGVLHSDQFEPMVLKKLLIEILRNS